ncbi:ribosome small subunit-dependent GTPase A [Cognatishimia sp. SS12]|uniref:ribosome small subunit-dependent GTPase A n=1 Tax=Cognatishimia sp. SS12 TaxID=2979465 RepID=UPI00232B2ECC|nr:ribosome small subunit-dependent GTPase A [Cognatishimia sp. SS12]MDC0739155.1 ribosome small subunit-dependent GTPase A [Cognatishimia sp. SS12]
MTFSYQDLGWSSFFARQHTDETSQPFRVSEVHRDRLIALCPDGPSSLSTPDHETGACAVGDWVLADSDHRVTEILDRKSLLQRRAAGHEVRSQLIAANVDTLFIVSSCNADFNIARLERYLALASSTDCYPVVLLTKADQCDDPSVYSDQIARLPHAPSVECLNAKDTAEVKSIMNWVRKGQTAAFVGSSGVGKTTLANTMTGGNDATQDIREDDARGRHTTTARFLKPMLNGGWLIDTPGMRELQLFDAQDGLEAVFEDLHALAAQCKFNDCAHESEPGCAVKAALERGEIDAPRLARWRKLERENELNSETIQQARARDKAFGKMVHNAVKASKFRKGG